MTLSNATAVTEINGTGVCVDRHGEAPQDYCIAVAQIDSRRMSVQVYCIPQAPGLAVYLISSSVAGYGPYGLPGDLMACSFVDSDGATLALLVRQQDSDGVFLMTSGGLAALPSVSPLIPSNQALVRVVSMWSIEDGLVVDAVVRGFDGTSMVGSMMNFRRVPHSARASGRTDTARASRWQVRASGQPFPMEDIADRPLAVRGALLVHPPAERAIPAAAQDPRPPSVHARVRVRRRCAYRPELGPARQPVPVLVPGRPIRGHHV